MADFIDVSGLLYPKSIAVIGATDRAGDLGGDAVHSLVRFGFPGRIWAVNPNAKTVHGVRCFAGIGDLPEAPDLVILAIPADAVAETIRACAAYGARHGVVFAGGFAEAGGEGVALQNVLGTVCRDVGFTLCGPNCVGGAKSCGLGANCSDWRRDLTGLFCQRPAGNKCTGWSSQLHLYCWSQ